MKPLPAWAKYYEPKNKDSFDTMIPFCGSWVDENATGIQVSPPYQSQGTTSFAAFGPLVGLAAAQSPVETANILATAWQTWYLAIQFTPSPPIPPFGSITAITPSPLGISAAYSTLLTGLVAELAVVPPDPTTGFIIKGSSYGALFQAATLAAGVQIVGFLPPVPPAPPIPLTIPLIPVL